ncbi:uncharacterized protein VNE69_12105 [Vairimorpha necatrix]|uniref:Serpin domain-containing protein n=1 Tax=Vairimorpha necatrix TaxID=6039 RepID=A0AAX4JGP8_9MICR
MYNLNNMMLDISNNIFIQLLQESDNTFVFSPLSIINLLWIYFNGFGNVSNNKKSMFLELDICRKSYNKEFHNLFHNLSDIFEKTNWYNKKSGGFLYLKNFVFCNKDLNLTRDFHKMISKSPYVKIQEFFNVLKNDEISQLINLTINKYTKFKLNNIPSTIQDKLNPKLVNTVLYKCIWKSSLQIN